MKRILAVVALLTLSVMCGCFDYEENLVLNKDGSGSIQMHYAVDKSYLDQMKNMYEQMAASMPELDVPDDPSETMFNESRIRETLAMERSGVTLDHYEISETETSKVWDMKFSFGDINDLAVLDKALSPEEEYESEESREQEEDEPFLVKQPDGTLLYLRPVADDSDEDQGYGDDHYSADEYADYDESYTTEYEGEYDDNSYAGQLGKEIEQGVDQWVGEMEAMTEGMADRTIRFVITFPGEILESNAAEVDGKTAVWEYKLGELQGRVEPQRAVIRP
ncbi:MAG: hypothetical protein JSW34_01605 [Candidatus Zixiibacteriota bacterium]|nr:MAG: hypothetical protein JSW34_01605 [candidate division Zixibacteria bacterium]